MIERKELEFLVSEKYSIAKIAMKFSLSKATIRHYLKKYGLKTNSDYFKKEYRCTCCGEVDKTKFMIKGNGQTSKTKCKSCHCKYTIERFRKNKRLAVDYLGGQCAKCGYKKCPGSMHFHHLDPNEKDPNWRKMRNWRFDKIKGELDKCQLLCSNCHGEEHWSLGKDF